MTVHWAFNHLGIDPTTTTSEIRRAYAHRLKAMDLDADVDGYAELRNARDVALAYAQGMYDDVVTDDVLNQGAEAAEARHDNRPEPAFEEPPADSARGADEPTDEIAFAQQRLIALLFPGGEQMYLLSPDEAEEALKCFATLKTDPRLEQIGVLASASDWFAQVIAQSIPRSDPLVRPVADYFGWSRDDAVGVHPEVAAVVSRANALDWRDQLTRRRHRLHRAWKELTKPANENSKRGWVSAKRVAELLKDVRTRHPSLEGDMDWYRVGLWENGASSRAGLGTGIFLAIFAFQVLRIAVSGDSASPPSTSPSPVETTFSRPVTTAEADIDEVLRGLTDADTVKTENPRLYSLLWTNWQAAKDNGDDLNQFVRSNRALLLERVGRSWAEASYTVLRHKMQTDVQIANQLTSEGCANLLGDAVPSLTQSQADMRFRVIGERLLEVDPTQALGPEVSGTYSFRIPGAVIADAMKRSGLSREQLSKGLDIRSSAGFRPATACNARLALREAILAQPQRVALPIMRDMEG